MGTRIFFSGICLSGFLAQVLAGGPPADTRAKAGTHRVAMQHGSSYLGIAVVEINPERAKALHLKEERGVEVTCLDPGSPAEKAGLQPGDVVLEYNGEHVQGGEQFVRLVRETPPGHTAKLVVWRSGATQTLTAAIGQRQLLPMVSQFDDDAFPTVIPPMPPCGPSPSRIFRARS
jgi:serine protease Do